MMHNITIQGKSINNIKDTNEIFNLEDLVRKIESIFLQAIRGTTLDEQFTFI